MSKWIIIVVKDDRYALPIMDDDDSPAVFDTQEEAQACANDHHLCQMFSGWLLDIVNGETEPY